MKVVGIDPGVSGAVAVVTGVDKAAVYDVPVVKGRRGGEGHSYYDLQGMLELLAECAAGATVCVVECCQPRPGISRVATFSLAYSYGCWLMACTALELPLESVRPQVWKRYMLPGGVGASASKELARIRAAELFPSLRHMLTKKKDDGRADALLLAEYGRRRLIDGAKD